VEAWFREIAGPELTARAFELARLHAQPIARVRVGNQRTRWGSCSISGTISLNWRLIQTPPFVRDYIIVHELMHLREMNHSRRFWEHVAAACPEYKSAEAWLRNNACLLR
jgi:predicted metal-dependent hydrolase